MEKLRNSGTAHQWHCYNSACEGRKGPKQTTCKATGATTTRNRLLGSFWQWFDSIQLTDQTWDPISGSISADTLCTSDLTPEPCIKTPEESCSHKLRLPYTKKGA